MNESVCVYVTELSIKCTMIRMKSPGIKSVQWILSVPQVSLNRWFNIDLGFHRCCAGGI